MLKTVYGVFDGKSWEELCQKCFKQKYGEEGYQEIKASPGDFGLEGFTRTGKAFQCYCPDEDYTMEELYKKQRIKITKDLNKLKKYEEDITKRLSNVIINTWYFVTPIINHNNILAHCSNKIIEVRSWNIPFLSKDFDIQVRDADFYATEITSIQIINGQKIAFDDIPPTLDLLQEGNEDTYQDNINRKNRKRIIDGNTDRVVRLNKLTFGNLIKGNKRLKTISQRSPDIYYSIQRIINQYSNDVEHLSLTWYGEPEELINKIQDGLNKLLEKDLPMISSADRISIVTHMVSKWLAICTLDFIEE